MGRQLQERDGQEKQVVIVMPILVGLDGHEKMSKSKGNYIAVTDEPNDMFGKVMSIPDSLMKNYYELLTSIPGDRICSLLDEKETHPREAKDILGRVIVEEFYNPQTAVEASEEFRRRFAENQLPTDLETIKLSENPIGLLQMICEAGFAASNSEARRFVQQGAVSLDNDKITDPKTQVTITGTQVLKVGKRKVCQVEA
jgi:tyrosyl-tRNA synthetase